MSKPTLYQRVGEPARVRGRKSGYRFVPVEPDEVLWCFTHYRIPEDGIDLCGDEWRDIGPCDFGKALIVRAGIGGDE